MLGSDLPTPNQVLKVYNRHKISKMFISETHEDVSPLLDALANDSTVDDNQIEVVLCIANSRLKDLARKDHSAAKAWVQKHTVDYPDLVGYVCVGDMSSATPRERNLIVPAMENIRSEIQNIADSSKPILVSTLADVSNLNSYNARKLPSDCKFNEDCINQLIDVLAFLNRTRPSPTPLFARIIPYFEIRDDVGLPNYLFTANRSNSYLQDKHNYAYVYDAMVDSIYYAMAQAGYDKVPMVSLSGWPTAGGSKSKSSEHATVSNSQEYIKNLAGRVNESTPMGRKCMGTFVYSLLDEDKAYKAEEEWKHFGAFAHWQSKTFPN